MPSVVSLQVTVLFAGQEIPKSPFEVNVDKAQGDPSKVTAKGPGLEPVGNIANKPTYFDIYTAGQLDTCLVFANVNIVMLVWQVDTRCKGIEQTLDSLRI